MTVAKWAGLTLIGLLLTGCSTTRPSPDVSGQIRRSLDDAGLKDVSVSQDRTKGVVTLTGSTPDDSDRSQAESIARSLAAGQVVADEIAVTPPGTTPGPSTPIWTKPLEKIWTLLCSRLTWIERFTTK